MCLQVNKKKGNLLPLLFCIQSSLIRNGNLFTILTLSDLDAYNDIVRRKESERVLTANRERMAKVLVNNNGSRDLASASYYSITHFLFRRKNRQKTRVQ